MKKGTDLYFMFGDVDYNNYGRCDFCGKRSRHHSHPITLMGYQHTKKEHLHGGTICSDCLTPDVKRLARIAWDRAEHFFASRPLKGFDADTWRQWGFDMRAISEALEELEDFSTINFGRAALMVAQECLELDPPRKGKAA